MRWPSIRVKEQADKGFGIYGLATQMDKEGAEVIHSIHNTIPRSDLLVGK